MGARGATVLTTMLLFSACACASASDDAADAPHVDTTTDAAPISISDTGTDHTATDHTGTDHTGTDHGLTAIVLQYREDEVRHMVSIKVRNTGAAPVRVVDLRLRWEGLEVVEPVVQDHLLGVGHALDLRTPYGDARCADGYSLDPPSTKSAFAEATIELTDGSTEMVTIPIDDVEEQLARLFRIDCRRQFIESVVTLELSGPWERIDPDGVATLRGTLAVERGVGDRAITISDVDGSVLLDVRPAAPASGPLLVLGPDDAAGVVPVDVTSARCDAHALGREQEDLRVPGRDRRRRRSRGRRHLAARRRRTGDVPGDRRRLRALTRCPSINPPGRRAPSGRRSRESQGAPDGRSPGGVDR